MFGGELFTEDMEEEFGNPCTCLIESLRYNVISKLRTMEKEDDDDKTNEARIFTAVAGASHLLTAKGQKFSAVKTFSDSAVTTILPNSTDQQQSFRALFLKTRQIFTTLMKRIV